VAILATPWPSRRPDLAVRAPNITGWRGARRELIWQGNASAAPKRRVSYIDLGKLADHGRVVLELSRPLKGEKGTIWARLYLLHPDGSLHKAVMACGRAKDAPLPTLKAWALEQAARLAAVCLYWTLEDAES
jgi:hypothetical protein